MDTLPGDSLSGGQSQKSDTWGLNYAENTRNFSKCLTVLIDSSHTLTENHPKNFGGQGRKSDGQGRKSDGQGHQGPVGGTFTHV